MVKISCLIQTKKIVAYEKVEICDGVFGSLFNNNLLLRLINNKIFVGEKISKYISSFTRQWICCLQAGRDL